MKKFITGSVVAALLLCSTQNTHALESQTKGKLAIGGAVATGIAGLGGAASCGYIAKQIHNKIKKLSTQRFATTHESNAAIEKAEQLRKQRNYWIAGAVFSILVGCGSATRFGFYAKSKMKTLANANTNAQTKRKREEDEQLQREEDIRRVNNPHNFDNPAPPVDSEEREQQVAAATRLQAIFRGHNARREVAPQLEAARVEAAREKQAQEVERQQLQAEVVQPPANPINQDLQLIEQHPEALINRLQGRNRPTLYVNPAAPGLESFLRQNQDIARQILRDHNVVIVQEEQQRALEAAVGPQRENTAAPQAQITEIIERPRSSQTQTDGLFSIEPKQKNARMRQRKQRPELLWRWGNINNGRHASTMAKTEPLPQQNKQHRLKPRRRSRVGHQRWVAKH